MGTIESKDGKLCVVDDWATGFMQPVQSRAWWPLGLNEKDYPELIGEKATYDRLSGTFEVRGPFGVRYYEMINGRDTLSCGIDTKPLKRPRWAKKWRDGEWHR